MTRENDPFGSPLPSSNQDAFYYMELGATYLELGSLADAADAFRQAIARDPNLAEAHFNLGTVLSDRKNAKGAMAAYRRAIELRPDFFEAQFNLGAMYANGEGVKQELVMAFKWLDLASNLGHQEAPQYRDAVAELLDENQLVSAQKLVKVWMDNWEQQQ